MTSAMTSLTLAPGVTCCKPGLRHVLLDQKADRYVALGEVEDEAVGQLLAGVPLTPVEQSRLHHLVERGLLGPSTQGASPSLCTAPVPALSIASSDSLSPHLLAQLAFVWRVVLARRRLRRHGLFASIEKFKIRKLSLVKPAGDPSLALREAAWLMRRITLYMTRHDQCLPVSLGLAHHLLRRKVPVTLMLGVQLGPFQAHCWIQAGEALIGEELEVARVFTPILAV